MISSVKYMPEYVILMLTGSTVNCSVFSRARPDHPKSKPVRPEEWAACFYRLEAVAVSRRGRAAQTPPNRGQPPNLADPKFWLRTRI